MSTNPTPAIREFLVRLDEMVDRRPWPELDRDGIATGSGHDAVLVRLPHRTDRAHDLEIVVSDRTVVVNYAPEHVEFTSRDEALQFIEMLGDGRVELHIARNIGWTTMRSYRDGLALPFRRTRMPWPTLRPRIETMHFGFA